ncbi:hypothetical protein AZ24_2568, partial [Bordetella bronchiseptica E013]
YAGKLGGVYSKRLLLAAIYGLRAFGMLLLLAVPLTPLVLYIFAGWMGCAGAGGLAGLGDRVGACAGYQVGLRRHRGAQYGVEPLHQNAAQGGRADTHVPLALPL